MQDITASFIANTEANTGSRRFNKGEFDLFRDFGIQTHIFQT